MDTQRFWNFHFLLTFLGTYKRSVVDILQIQFVVVCSSDMLLEGGVNYT